jgi:hypothetical protein
MTHYLLLRLFFVFWSWLEVGCVTMGVDLKTWALCYGSPRLLANGVSRVISRRAGKKQQARQELTLKLDDPQTTLRNVFPILVSASTTGRP